MPKIGQMVVYHTAGEQRNKMENAPECNVQTELPAIIVAVWSDNCVNLQVIPDGNPTEGFWVTSALKGTDEYNWEPIEN